MNGNEHSQMQEKARMHRALLRFGIDPWLLIIVVTMITFGMVMVYSSTLDVSWKATGDPYAMFRNQAQNLALSVVVLLGATFFPLNWLRKLALPIIVVSILALFVVLLMGVSEGSDAPRRAFLNGSIQPSEMAKLAVIIYLAVWMESKKDKLSEWGYGLLPLMGIIAIVAALILKQPDLSAAITVVAIAFVMFYIAGASFIQTVAIVLGGAASGMGIVLITNTGRARWDAFVQGLMDIEKASYHVQRALQAFYSGGIFGRGLGASHEKFGLLPVPHTDSVFAVLGEELGLIGAITVVLLFSVFIWRGFKVSLDAKDDLCVVLGIGIVFWIGIEAFVNMSVLLGLLPFAGNALPLFSYGGSSLMVTLAGMGLLFNVSRNQKQRAGIKTDVTSIGFSGRNRRRRVSSAGRRRSAEG